MKINENIAPEEQHAKIVPVVLERKNRHLNGYHGPTVIKETQNKDRVYSFAEG
jgi:hypothetical protein